MAAKFIILLLAIAMATVSATEWGGSESAEAGTLKTTYSQNLDNSLKMTVALSAPVALSAKGFLRSILKNSVKRVLVCGEAFTGGAAVGSYLGSLVSDPPGVDITQPPAVPRLVISEAYGACGIDSPTLAEVEEELFVRHLPGFMEASLPYGLMMQAIPETLERLLTAEQLGDQDAAAIQLAALRLHVQQIVSATPAVLGAVELLQSEWPSFLASFPEIRGPENLAIHQQQLAQEGLPPEEVAVLTLLGVAAEDIETTRQLLIAANPSDIAAGIDLLWARFGESIRALTNQLQALTVTPVGGFTELLENPAAAAEDRSPADGLLAMPTTATVATSSIAIVAVAGAWYGWSRVANRRRHTR